VILQENLRLRNSSKLKEQAQVFHLTENQESLFDPKAHLSNPKARRILVLFLNNVSSMIFHSYIRNCTSSLIFFVYWDLRRLPAGRQGRPKRPNINLAPITFLFFLPTGKVADNHDFLFEFSP